MTSSAGWNSRFFGLENGFRSTANTWSRFSAENERIWSPRQRNFSEFVVFSAFCTKNGVVTKTGDIGKTFSGLKNLAVLQGFGTKNPNELGWYKQPFLTTPAWRHIFPTGLRGFVFFFQWSAQTEPGGFGLVLVCPTGLEGFRFSMVRPTGPAGSFFNGPPNAPVNGPPNGSAG